VRRSIRKGDTAVLDDTQRAGRHRNAQPLLSALARRGRARLAVFRVRLVPRRKPHSAHSMGSWIRPRRTVTTSAVIITAAVIAVIVALYGKSAGGKSFDPVTPPTSAVPPGSYIGVYAPGVPESYAGIRAFTAATGVRPGVVVYYSGWLEPFKAAFAAEAARHDAVPLVQINPTGISVAAIASGHYDAYLRSYASEVKSFGRRVILSFGHEMNGSWYSWGYRHTSPAVFVAAWRHIVTVFRSVGARNVIWLWTINIIRCRCSSGSLTQWWPGKSYVNWVGIDGYYYKPSWKFAPLFGPTIKAVRALTLDPILISETAAPAARQPAKIADLVAGVRAYGLVGFVWFNADQRVHWRISSRAASAAFRRGVGTLKRATS
jgi:Glycosyl hydrolase family 26